MTDRFHDDRCRVFPKSGAISACAANGGRRRSDCRRGARGGLRGHCRHPILLARPKRRVGRRTGRFGATPSPAWTKDLIIYEISPRASLRRKDPRAARSTVSRPSCPTFTNWALTVFGWPAIWRAAHTYFNIWSQYANLEPDKIEPSLGTPQEFHSLVRAAHRHGIRIFLDVHVHGVHPAAR